jgi:hypothetical protein
MLGARLKIAKEITTNVRIADNLTNLGFGNLIGGCDLFSFRASILR